MPKLFEPDWYYGVTDKTFKKWLDADFQGVGWYTFKNKCTGLVVGDGERDGETFYKVLFYNERDPRHLIQAILDYPTHDVSNIKHIKRCWKCFGVGLIDERSFPSGCRTGKKTTCYVCDGSGKTDKPEPDYSRDYGY